MTTELKPFTASDLAANMQGKIRQVIAESLPEDDQEFLDICTHGF